MEDVVSPFKVHFEEIEWQHIRPDVRQKVHCDGVRQIRLVEFDASDGPQHWCETGHVGYVLRGALTISFAGEEVAFEAGDALVIPSGVDTRHRAVSIAQGTQLLMIEDT
jgi:quercetin dioxygenase-like cupin family protein